MKKSLLAVLLTLVFTVPAFGSNFFQIELAGNVIQDTEFEIDTGVDNLLMELESGRSFGMFIGSEMALDFNLKLDVELGMHGGKYYLDDYNLNGTSESKASSHSYYNYVMFTGVRLKYDWQITDTISVEPYLLAALTPVYMYSPSTALEEKIDGDLSLAGTYVFDQSNVWALDCFGFGLDLDLTRSSVEYSGSSKYLFGFSIRRLHRAVSFEDNVEDTKVNLLCLTGTILF